MKRFTIQETMRERGWDWTIIRQKLIATYIQNGLPVPSDNGMRGWIFGGVPPKGQDLEMFCIVFRCEEEQLLVR